MTVIGASLGGASPRQPQGSRSGVDWERDQKFATPKAPPDFQRRRQEQMKVDVPQLPERNIRVRAVAPATYYTTEGMPIPPEQWVTLPISPTLIQAIKDGDLERGPDPEEDEGAHHSRRHRTTHAHSE